MLKEFALTPNVLRTSEYEGPKHCSSVMSQLKKVLLHDGIVRDLKEQKWSSHAASLDNLDPKAKELLKKLKLNGRLKAHKECAPGEDNWLDEARASASDQTNPLSGILTDQDTQAANQDSDLIASVHHLAGSSCWNNPTSMFVPRTADGITSALRPLFLYAPSVTIIDPHFDPSDDDFNWLGNFLIDFRKKRPLPNLEIHRCNHTGTGEHAKIFRREEIEGKFRNAWQSLFEKHNISIEIVVWPDFHDRFILTPLLGVLASNSLDTTPANKHIVFAKLSREDKELVYQRFDKSRSADPVKKPDYSFKVGRTL